MQARVFAENRILLGLHYPSDVASGWTAGTLAVYVMMRDRAFQRDFAAAKAEITPSKFLTKLRSTVAYDGTDFRGFQWQPAGRTVVGVLEAALAQLFGESTRVTGAGRTDRGVHATGQVVSFSTTEGIPVRTARRRAQRRLAAGLLDSRERAGRSRFLRPLLARESEPIRT